LDFFSGCLIFIFIATTQSLPGYYNFAKNERERMKNSVQEHLQKHDQILGEKFAVSVAAFQQEIRALKDSQDEMKHKMLCIQEELQRSNKEMKTMMQTIINNQTFTNNTSNVGLAVVTPATPLAKKPPGVATALGLNAFQLMQNTPRVPSMTQNFPESWSILLNEWQANDLGDFEKKGTKGIWKNDLQQRYAKRQRAMKVLRKTAGSRKTLKLMAADLDIARVSMNVSLTKHIQMLYKMNCEYKPRARESK
jgi:hypothetical protein